MKDSLGMWVGWLAFFLAIVGFYYAPFCLGGMAIVLGIICLASPHKLLAWLSIALGVTAFLLPML